RPFDHRDPAGRALGQAAAGVKLVEPRLVLQRQDQPLAGGNIERATAFDGELGHRADSGVVVIQDWGAPTGSRASAVLSRPASPPGVPASVASLVEAAGSGAAASGVAARTGVRAMIVCPGLGASARSAAKT